MRYINLRFTYLLLLTNAKGCIWKFVAKTVPEYYVHVYISAADSMGLSAFKFLWWALKDRHVM